MRESIVKAFPRTEISVSIVWINMLPDDDEAAAKIAARTTQSSRVQQFYDPRRRAGEAIAREMLLEGAGPAWDIYLFYAAGSEWSTRPPRPAEWVHQLSGGQRADPARFRSGEQLVRALSASMKRLVERNRRLRR